MEVSIRTLDELAKEAMRFVDTLVPKVSRATLVTLQGDLGAGKTAFTQAVATALGVEESVTSPTFVLEKVYALRDTKCPSAAEGHLVSRSRGFKQLVHIDAYRLEGAAELAPLDFDELMREPTNLVILEWPEKVGLNEANVRISLKANADESRTLTYG